MHEFPPAVGTLPLHRSDTGAFLLADAYGAARMLYVKDTDAVDESRISVGELLAQGPPPVDALVLELMNRATHVREIQIVNGLTPGAITAAPAGEAVGTVAHAD